MEEQAKSNLLKLQNGGGVSKLNPALLRKPSLTKEVTPDNTKVKPNLLSKIKPTDYTIKNQLGETLKPGDPGFWDRAKTVNEYRNQGVVEATRDRSLREKVILGIQNLNSFSMAPGGTSNNLTPILTETVAAGARLLRPDKSYKGLLRGTTDQFEESAKDLAWDALAFLPAVRYVKPVVKAPARAVKSVGQAIAPYTSVAKKTFKATSDLPFAKRLQNAVNSGTLGKPMPGDINSRTYFAMTPQDVAAKMKKELTNMPVGASTTEQSLSLNSQPIFWNQAARGGKEWTIIRNGPMDELNSSGVNGKRIYDAIPEQIRIQNAPAKEMLDHRIADLKDKFKSGLIDEQDFQLRKTKAEGEFNSHLLTEISPMHGNDYWWKDFLSNYKPTLDNPIAAVNAKTGLNFPATEITKVHGRKFYKSPQLTAVKGMKERMNSTLNNMVDATRQNYILNGRLDKLNKMPSSLTGVERGASAYDEMQSIVNSKRLPNSVFNELLNIQDVKLKETMKMQKLFLESLPKGSSTVRPDGPSSGGTPPPNGNTLPPPPDEIRF